MEDKLMKTIHFLFFWKIRNLQSKLINTLDYYLLKKEMIFAAWWDKDGGTNWGDALNPILIGHLSKKKVIHYQNIYKYNDIKVYSVIGSILGTYNKDKLIVWGSGCISSSSKIKKNINVHAVRGPLTRDILLSQRIECPEVYGDPALLYPLFYNPPKTMEYKLGIIPHFIDKDNPVIHNFADKPDILIIDVMGDINDFIDKICSCQMIASSSLHGLIAADAYGIPSIWIEFSDKIRGKRFKYQDYFLSVGRLEEEPLFISNEIAVEDIIQRKKDYRINLDLVNLLKSCPFLETENLNILITDLKNLVLDNYIQNDGMKF